MTDLDFPPWTQRLGGRWLVSWQLYALGTPLAFIVFTASGIALAPAGTPVVALVAWVGAVATACIAVAAWMWFGGAVLFRQRELHAVPWPLAIAFLGSFGALFVLTLIGAAGAYSATPLPNPAWALVINTILAAWWGTTVDLVLDSRERVLAARSSLIEAAVQQELVALNEVDALGRLRDVIDAQVEAELAPARTALAEALDAAQASAEQGRWSSVADGLRRTAHTSVRSLSATMWQATEEAYPRPALIPTLLGITRTQPLRPFAVAGIYVIAAVATQIDRHGVLVGIALTLVGAVGVIVVLGGGNRLMRAYPQRHQSIFLGTLTVFAGGGIASMCVEAAGTGRSVEVGSIVVSLIATLVIVLGTSAFGAVHRANVDLLQAFASEIDAERVAALARSRELARIARLASRVLHGQVQTRLVACAAVIDRASSTGDSETLAAAVDEARRILDQPLRFPDPPRSVLEAVLHHRNRWSGIVEVDYDISQELGALDGRLAGEVSLVVEEGVSNAYRHGRATHVHVRVGDAGSEIVILVRDNGSGCGARQRQGTGMVMLAQLSVGAVNLVDDAAGGACLEVRLSRESSPSAPGHLPRGSGIPDQGPAPTGLSPSSGFRVPWARM